MNNFADLNPKFSTRQISHLFFLDHAISFFFYLTITRSLRFILWHASRSPAETGVPMRDKAWYIDSSRCVSWILSGTGFISITSLLRNCKESKVFLCNVSICLEISFVQFFETSSSDSTRVYFSSNSSNLEDLQHLHELSLLLVTLPLVLPC